MRCPKCSYISFDKETSCAKCSTDVTEVAQALNGTAFRSLGTFYLGTLIPDYAAAFVSSDEVAGDFSMDAGGDELDISMDGIGDFGEVPDLPGDVGEEEFALDGDISDFGDEDISLDDHEVPDMDLSGFGEDHTGFSPAPVEEAVEDVGLDDVPDFDLSGIDFEGDSDLEMAGEELEEASSATPDLSDIDLSLGEGDLEMESGTKKEENGLGELPDLEL